MQNLRKTYSAALSLCLIAVALFATLDSPHSIGNSASAASSSVVDISGPWNSQFGTINLKVEGKDNDGQVVVSGWWNNGGSTAEIVYGRFHPATAGGILKVEYYVAQRQIYGYAEFKLSPNLTVLTGKYDETDQHGDWVLTRAKGFSTKYLTDLQVLTNLGRNKHSTVLTNPAGKWNSNFGVVELQTTGNTRGILINGKFTRPDGKVGKIDSGTYLRDSKGGLMRLQYSTPWNNGKGSGTFRPDLKIADRQLLGIYEEAGQTGQWILSRPLPK
ncbi:hypothetical protein KF728_23565 [Candidatus Obscuribacterales bacterium]|nr:hypothetical protein [Candidatus Obscuribacterales bacterium]MBX3153160.1 hypothetical protein [Candidatus Obscuribacterales bacterium]